MDDNFLYKSLKNYMDGLYQLSHGSFDLAKPLFRSRRYQPESLLCRQGEIEKNIYFIVSGLVRIYYITDCGNERNKAFYSNCSVVAPYRSLLTGQISNLNIQCLEETVVLYANFEKVRELNDRIMDLQIIARKIAEQEFIKKDSREFQFLTMNASQRYHAFLEEYADLCDRIPSKHIALYLGIRRETLSRLKSLSETY